MARYQRDPPTLTNLIDEAKSDVCDLSFKYGCKDQQIGELLAVYHNELEPTLH
jgi:flagellar basal body-associated protein FliL